MQTLKLPITESILIQMLQESMFKYLITADNKYITADPDEADCYHIWGPKQTQDEVPEFANNITFLELCCYFDHDLMPEKADIILKEKVRAGKCILTMHIEPDGDRGQPVYSAWDYNDDEESDPNPLFEGSYLELTDWYLTYIQNPKQ